MAFKLMEEEMILKKNGARTLMYHGHKFIGDVEKRASPFSRNVMKWHAKHCGIVSVFDLKREALSWLWTMHENPAATSHLREMKKFHEFVDNDNGFYDVLHAFAEGLGFRFIQDEFEGKTRNLVGMVWQHEKKMYIEEFRPRVEKAMTLAHELAHYYMYILGHTPMNFHAEEQIVEAVAVAILKDYDIDTMHQGLCYIYHHTNQHFAFARGELDSRFVSCYNRFSKDLKTFLERR